MSDLHDEALEWLEADGLGGFASGTVAGVRTRRYHALLLASARPPTERYVLVNGVEAVVADGAAEPTALAGQRYAPGVIGPAARAHLEAFESVPWPRWIYRLATGARVAHEVVVRPGAPAVALSWRLLERPRSGPVRLEVRPFFSGRDYHALHHENPAFGFSPDGEGARLRWRPYPGVPAVVAAHNGAYRHDPHWYRQFLYSEEAARGLDAVEDLAAPGRFVFDLGAGEAVLVLAAEHDGGLPVVDDRPIAEWLEALRLVERARRGAFPSRLHRAADAYVVARGAGKTIIAGYPWFADWGRDTFIALRGLCLATGRFDDARTILAEWAGAVSDGMLPNRFPDRGAEPEHNSVDASLWYVVAVGDYVRRARRAEPRLVEPRLVEAVRAILSGYAIGTRYRIGADADGLLAAGVPGQQLTWMDARVDGWEVTPRIGKPVEIQALWLNALAVGAELDRERGGEWRERFERGLASFRARFWNEGAGCLYDVVDVDHRPGVVDATLRPNQILAVGGLPLPVVDGVWARSVVDVVERALWTPRGLRSLAPGAPGYARAYTGGPRERDSVYHQGTVWPWLAGPFVEAWVRVRGGTISVKREAYARFVAPLIAHLDEAGLGHVSEIADAEPPFTPRGAPFQAWSVGELLRLVDDVLVAPAIQATTAPYGGVAPEKEGPR
jgi:predicted glycogen debranching enzyme